MEFHSDTARFVRSVLFMLSIMSTAALAHRNEIRAEGALLIMEMKMQLPSNASSESNQNVLNTENTSGKRSPAIEVVKQTTITHRGERKSHP